MIKYKVPPELYNSKGSQIEKDREELLESALRKLGNFNKQEPINVEDFKDGKEYYDIIYEVKDIDDTIFNFYNFHIGNDIKTTERFSESYQLTMQRKNSNTLYKYDFSSTNYGHTMQNLRLIELMYQLSENRLIKLERKLYMPIIIKFIENNKEYILGFYDYSDENDSKLLENFGNIINQAKELETLNLENAMKIMPDPNKVSFCCIRKNDEIIASASFNNSNITEYKIIDGIVEVRVNIADQIRIKTTIENNKSSEAIITDNYEKVQTEVKRLLKSL